MSAECLFCKIAKGLIPVTFVYEDEEFVAFNDQNPQAPVHILLIPRSHFPTIMDVEDTVMAGRAMQIIKEIANGQGMAEEGFRVVMNCRDNGGQTVYHLHWHILGGRFMQWPPG